MTSPPTSAGEELPEAVSSPPGAAPAPASTAQPPVNPWFAMLAIALGVTVVMLDGTITAVANPELALDLGATLSDLQWITNVYLLALAATLVLVGKLGDRYGRRTIFLIGVGGFGLASVAIGSAPAVSAVIVARAFQGLFGAMIITNSLSLLRATFSVAELPRALAVFSAITGLSTAAGPIVGGLLVDALSWRWAFYINAPVVLLSILVGLRALRRTPPEPHGRFDILGMVLLVGTLLSFTYAVIQAPEIGWGDPLVIALFALSAVLLVVFVLAERRAEDPLMPLYLFRNRSITAGAVLTLIVFLAMMGALFFLMLFMQQLNGDSPLMAGVKMLPMSIGSMIGASLAGGLLPRIGPRPPLVVGMLITAASMFLMLLIDVGDSYLVLGVPLALLGFALGCVMTSSIQAIMGNVSESDAGPAGGLQQTANQIGAILGTSVLGAVMAAVADSGFTEALRDQGAPEPVVTALSGEGAALVGQGVAPIPPDATPALAGMIRSATETAFVDGMHMVMLVAGIVAVVGALVGLLVRRGRVVEGAAVMH